MNVPNNDTMNGRRVRYGKDLPDYPKEQQGADLTQGGQWVCFPGDLGTVEQGFDKWNGVDGLTIFYVRFDRGTSSHFSVNEIEFI